MKNALLHIENLSTGYNFGKRDELILHRDLNLELMPGELICLLGPNGAGKSTLLKTVLGFEKAFSGKIYLNGIPSEKLNFREKAKLVSVVLTEKIDDSYLTAFEVVASGRYPYGSFLGKLNKEDKNIIEQAINLIGIETFSQKNFQQLSDGEKQKVMIARTIAQDTPLIFLDEPVAFVDSPSKVELMNLIRKLTDEHNKGVLLATHDLEAAIEYADRIWLIGKNGEYETGEPKMLIEEGKINHFFDRKNVTFNIKTHRFESKK